MKLRPGQMFAGRFWIAREIGEGGFGEVYEAEDRRGGDRVALKVLRPAPVSHPTLRERFEQESRITSSFQNPHIVTVVDAGVDDGTGRPWA